MTYMKPQRARAWAGPVRRRGMGGDLADLIRQTTSMFSNPSAEQMACLEEGNAKAAGIDAEIRNLNLNWHPTGFYTPEEMQRIASETLKVLSKANDLVRAAPLSTSDARELANNALKSAHEKSAQALNYSKAVGEAQQKGLRSINAPGLKQWVISSMLAASHSIVTAGVLECNMTWLASAIIAFQKVFDVAANVIKRVVGVAIKIGEVVLDVVEESPALLQKLFFIAKWGLVACAAVYAVKRVKEARGG